MRRSILVGILAALIAAVALLVPAAPAAAHGELIESRPAKDSTVGGTIDLLELQFVGIAHPGDHRLTITGPDGMNVTTKGEVGLDFQKLTLPIEALTEPGEYAINYRVDGIDGDVSVGTFTFLYEPSAPPPAALTRLQGSVEPERTELQIGIVILAVVATVFLAWILRRLWLTRDR